MYYGHLLMYESFYLYLWCLKNNENKKDFLFENL